MSATAPPFFRLLVGLGNPGREYRDTRHNVGFMLLDRLASAARAEFRSEKGWRAEVARAADVLLVKPQTFMNLSGQAVQSVASFYKVPPAGTLVIFDDMALPLGKLRMRPGGSAGGHNGLRSLIEHLGTSAIPRLRIGIGAAEPGSAAGHVLGRFTLEEATLLGESLERAAAAVACAQTQGLAAAMNSFN
jgi:PTH1 family peptidyl-tRNA hydrolase